MNEKSTMAVLVMMMFDLATDCLVYLPHSCRSGLVAETLATVLLLCKRYSISPAPSDLPNVTKPPSPVDDCVQYTHWEYVPRFHPRARLLRGLVASVTAWNRVLLEGAWGLIAGGYFFLPKCMSRWRFNVLTLHYGL